MNTTELIKFLQDNLPDTVLLSDLHSSCQAILDERKNFISRGFNDMAQSFGSATLSLCKMAEETGLLGTSRVIYDTEKRLFSTPSE